MMTSIIIIIVKQSHVRMALLNELVCAPLDGSTSRG